MGTILVTKFKSQNASHTILVTHFVATTDTAVNTVTTVTTVATVANVTTFTTIS